MINRKILSDLYILPLVLVILVIAGCQHALVKPKPQCDFTVMNSQPPATGAVLVSLVPGSVTPIPLNAVNITDRAITNKIMVQATHGERLETGDVKTFARFVNCTDYPLQVEARTHFLDARQVNAEPVTAWNRIHLPAHTIGNYVVQSTAGNIIESYLIELREGK